MEEKEQQVLITLSDTGIGIPEKFHVGLFDKFNDARRPRLKGEPSVGLGMSIIKTIVDLHHGRIWFESQEGQGTALEPQEAALLDRPWFGGTSWRSAGTM